jgi:hypothetical protein
MKKVLNFDFFAHPPLLNINGKENYKTCCGIFSSYLICFLSLSALYYFGSEMYFYQNPSVVMSENSFDEYLQPELNLRSKEFQMGFGILKDGKLVEYDPRYLTITAKIRRWERLASGSFKRSTTDLQLRKCNENDFFLKTNKKMQEHLKPLSVELMKCLEFSDNDDLLIKGTFGRSNYTSLVMYINECKNSSDNNSIICHSEEEISQMISNVYLGGMFINKYLDPKEFENPIDLGVEYFYLLPSRRYNKELQIKFQKIKLTTDIGWINPSYKVEEHIVLSSISERIRTEGQNDDSLAIISFFMEVSEKSYARHYKKIHEVLASVGGIIKACMTIISFIIQYPVKKKYENYLVNLLCKNTFNEPSEVDESISISQIIKRKFGYFFCRKKERKKYEFAAQVLREKMDLIRHIRKMVEIDVLKSVLFESRSQISLFQFCCSKVFWNYFKEKNYERGFPVQDHLKNYPTIRNIKNCYENIQKESERNLFSKKLSRLYEKISLEKKIPTKEEAGSFIMDEKIEEEEQKFPIFLEMKFKKKTSVTE